MSKLKFQNQDLKLKTPSLLINKWHILICIVGLAIIAWFLSLQKQNPYPDFQIVQYKLQNKQLSLLLADTPAKWEKGLMNYRELQGVDGMLFRFRDTAVRSFWNKNTLMNLDVYWIANGSVVGKSVLSSIEKSNKQVTVTSPQQVNEVVEIPVK